MKIATSDRRSLVHRSLSVEYSLSDVEELHLTVVDLLQDDVRFVAFEMLVHLQRRVDDVDGVSEIQDLRRLAPQIDADAAEATVGSAPEDVTALGHQRHQSHRRRGGATSGRKGMKSVSEGKRASESEGVRKRGPKGAHKRGPKGARKRAVRQRRAVCKKLISGQVSEQEDSQSHVIANRR